MTMLAAFKVLLYRYTGQDDLIVGTPIANRNRLETEGLIGFFVNALVLRTDFPAIPVSASSCGGCGRYVSEAYAHQDLPFDRLVEELHVQRELNRNPLFQVMFALHDVSLRAVELAGLSHEPCRGRQRDGSLRFDAADCGHGQELTALFVYDTDFFEAGTIARMLGNFQTLLEAIVADPERRLSDLPLLTDSGAATAAGGVEWHQDRSSAAICIHRLFEAQVERTPDAVAVVFEAEQLTYAELNRARQPIGASLAGTGSRTRGDRGRLPGTLVGVDRRIAGHSQGRRRVPAFGPGLSDGTPRLNAERCPGAGGVDPEAVGGRLAKQDVKIVDSVRIGRPSLVPMERIPTARSAPKIWLMSYTHRDRPGEPKGVPVSHGAIAGHCRTVLRHYELNPTDVVLQFASLSFDVSLEEILPTLIVGARLVLMGANDLAPGGISAKDRGIRIDSAQYSNRLLAGAGSRMGGRLGVRPEYPAQALHCRRRSDVARCS